MSESPPFNFSEKLSKKDLFERFGQEFEKGQVIFSEGDEGRHLYILQEGEVLITKKIRSQEKPLATFKAGDFFGEMAILNKQPRSATAVAHAPCKCLMFDEKTVEAMLVNHSQVAVRFIRKLSDRLRQASAMIENLMLKDDYSKVTNSLIQLFTHLKPKESGLKEEIKLSEVAVHSGVSPAVVKFYFKRLAELGIVQFAEEREMAAVQNLERLKRLKEYLEMREEFIVLEKPEGEARALVDESGKPRVSFF